MLKSDCGFLATTGEAPRRSSEAELAKENNETTIIRSVARASRILLFLANRVEPATAKETAVALGMHIATTYHLLATLVSEGLVAKDATRRYTLGPKIGVLSDAMDRQLSPPPALINGLRQLAHESQETAYLSGWRQGDIVVLASFEGSHAVRVGGLHRGMGGQAHARASGKVILAYAHPDARAAYFARHPIVPVTSKTIVDADKLEAEFARIRERGYSCDEGEFAEGVACAAAPVFDGDHVTAVFTVSAPLERYRETHERLVEMVTSTARAASSPLVPA
jgi:IclR family acetate operon transcriptional repressor